jgi:hypothetical protein
MVGVMLSSLLVPYSAAPVHAAAIETSTFMFGSTTTFNSPNLDMIQGYTPAGASSSCPSALGANWTCTWSSDTFVAGQSMAGGNASVHLYPENSVSTIGFRAAATALRSQSKTRFYMQTAAAAVDPATVRGAWDDATYSPRALSRTKSGTITTVAKAETSPTGDYDVLLLKLVSEPIPIAQTISGTLNWVVGVRQSNNNMNAHWHVHVYVLRGTNTLVGTLYSDYTEPAATNEWSGTAEGLGPVAALTLSPVTIQANDRIVIEAGYTSRNTDTTSRTGTMWIGGTGFDLGVGGDETAGTGWWEFSQDLFGLSVNKPTGTVQNDVMIASVAIQPNTATITPPPGWTPVRQLANTVNATPARYQTLAVYYKVAGASEPATYEWQYSGTAQVVGIQAFSGVDTANPINVENGQSNPAGPSHSTPSVTTTVAGTMLVASYGIEYDWVTLTVPTDMTQAFNHSGSCSGCAVWYESLAASWAPQGAAGATGAKTATTWVGVTGGTPASYPSNAHILALKPSAAGGSGTLTVQVLRNTTVLGSTTINPGAGGLVTATVPVTGVTFADGDRLHVKVIAPNDPTNVNARIWYDGSTQQSRLVTPTISCDAAEAVYAAATAASGQVTTYWSSANPVIVLEKPNAAITEVPVNRTTYAVGNTIGGATVRASSAAGETSLTRTGLVAGTPYYYKIFAKNAAGCYALGTEVDGTPPAGTRPSWSYMHAGGSMLKPGISGYGALYTGSNSGRIIGLDTSSGAHLWDPVTTSGVVQGWLSWLPGGWQYRKQITIDNTKVSADLTDFPVLIQFTDPDLQSSAQPGTSISHIGSAAAAAASVTLPAHQPGDLIIVFAARSAGAAPETVPSLPTGWTSIGTSQRDFWATRVGYKVATSSSETTGTWTNAVRIAALVYRGTDPTAPIGATATAGSTSGNVATYPALALSGVTPWVVGVAGHRTADNVEVAPAGMMNRVSNGAGGEVAAHDTNGSVSSWSGQTVSLSGTSAWDAWTIEIKPQGGGGDIVFTAADGTPLSHEIEQYDGSTGKLTAWVRVPSLSSTSPTVLHMYYGDATAPNQQDSANVWDSAFKGVWHLSQDPAGAAPQIQDATSNPTPNDGTSSGAMAAAQQVAGKVGGSLNFDGADDFVILGNPTPASLRINGAITVEAWINSSVAQTSQPQWAKIVQDWAGTTSGGYGLFFDDTRTLIGLSTSNGTAQDNIFVPITMTQGEWHHVVATWSPSPGSKVVYVDGVQQTPQASGNATIKSNTVWYMGLGNSEPGGCVNCFNGKIDEVRISNVARSAAWIATSYNSQSAPGTIPTTAGTFYVVGAAEQTVTGGTIIGGDQSGRVHSVDAFIGATNWTANLSAKADAIQAGVAVQMRAYSDAAFRAQYTTDVIFAASRNTTATNCGTAATNNKLFALRGDTGASLWTFNDTCTYSIDYVVGMPYVDYARNRVYVATRGAGSTLWILNSLDGSIVQQLALGHLDTSPALSVDGATIYVGSAAGRLYAVDTTTFSSTYYDLGSGVKSVVWEDWSVAGRLYFTTMDGNVWCLQNDGGTFSQVWTVPIAGASTPLLLDKLYVGSSDGRMHELDTNGGNEKVFPTTGTLDGAAFVGDVSTEDGTHVFVGTSGGKLFKIQVPLP